MKKPYVVVSTLLAIMQFAYRAEAQTGLEKGRGKLEGTWECVSYKSGEETRFSEFPKNEKHIKLITPTHFTWVTYDVDKKKALSTAGGTYSLEGDSYKEQIEFAGEGVEELAGKEQSFKIKVEGNKWSLSGVLSSGVKIEEVWKRVQ